MPFSARCSAANRYSSIATLLAVPALTAVHRLHGHEAAKAFANPTVAGCSRLAGFSFAHLTKAAAICLLDTSFGRQMAKNDSSSAGRPDLMAACIIATRYPAQNPLT